MSLLIRIGARGPLVVEIQRKLQALQLYLGELDGHFGGGTLSAVKNFQRKNQLQVDGIVGPKTWAVLYPGREPMEHFLPRKTSLLQRCLELTATIETGYKAPRCYTCVAGNFDRQGISYGALQWNLGQRSLQPLFHTYETRHPNGLDEVFDDYAPVLREVLQKPLEEQLAWAVSIQTAKYRVMEPWVGFFEALGMRKEFQDIQIEFAAARYKKALGYCRTYQVNSERAVAMMFDIVTQNGSIGKTTREQIFQHFAETAFSEDPSVKEVQQLEIIARLRAQASAKRWQSDVLSRKLTIARGEGVIHGEYFDLETIYGIRNVQAGELIGQP